MSRFTDRIKHALFNALVVGGISLLAGQVAAQTRTAGVPAPKPWDQVGRTATPAEIRAWDIDVRADFKGLPAGSGSVEKGQEVWEAKCASCHGTFGESTEVFTPIVGGTTKDDIRTGRVANLTRRDYPQRTTMMKVSQVSTLWDYINRAMPWNAPKSLKTDEVYAVLAFILNLADVVPEDFVLSNENIATVQQRLPNRNGAQVYVAMWDVSGKPDVQGSDCMKNCGTDMEVRSQLPDYARDSHGNLAEQNRVVGPFRGVDTTNPPGAETAKLAIAATTKADAQRGQAANASAGKSGVQIAKDANCLACHGLDRKIVGPSFKEVAAKYRGDAKAPEALAAKIRNGGQGVWGAIPMPPNQQLSAGDLNSVVDWILGGAQ